MGLDRGKGLLYPRKPLKSSDLGVEEEAQEAVPDAPQEGRKSPRISVEKRVNKQGKSVLLTRYDW